MTADQLRNIAVTLIVSLILLVLAWHLMQGLTPSRLLLAATLTLPLWPPLRGIARGHRKTYAWGTLCVIPYFILGVTEAVADPSERLWSAFCLILALALFAVLILFLRITNPARRPA